MLLKSKSAQMTTKLVTSVIIGIIILVVILQVYSVIVPEAQAAGDGLGDAERCSVAGGFFNTSQSACLNGTTPADTLSVNFTAVPLSSLFSSTGVVFVIVMAVLIILIVKSFIGKGK